MTDLATALLELHTTAPHQAIDAALLAAGTIDGYTTHDSPVGELYVAFNRRGISAVDMADSPEDFEGRFAHTHGRRAIPVGELPESLAQRLDKAIDDGRPGSLPLDFRGLTEFQAAVLRKTAEIPGGEVRPYSWVAREIGRPGAVRAVGSALAKNPVPIVVPCHRVVRTDGRLGNYSLGDAGNKRVLLESEGLDLDRLQELADRGVRFTGSETTGVYCHPTCGHAYRIGAEHRVEFGSETEAEEAGFRPCKVCRPAAA